MTDEIPFGPEQLPWKDTVASVAKQNGEYLVSPPSQDPKEVYKFPETEKGITPKYYQVPSKGMTADEARIAQDETYKISAQQTINFLGYQVTLRDDYSVAAKYLTTQINNVGDPFTPGSFTLNSKWMERNVLDYYASLWNAKWPHDSNDPDTYWGYVLTMGSSEANLYGTWNARDYLQGKFMMTDKSSPNPRVYYVRAKVGRDQSPNAFTPVAFYSEDTHYSLVKAMAVMEISTFYEIGNTNYPGQCPIAGTNGDWPLEVPSLESGSVDIDKLAQLVEFFAKEGYPPLIVMNYGTTFKGAYDDVKTATDKIMPILTKYGLNQRIITVTDPHDPNSQKRVRRNGYWFHVDGALGASYMPFLKMAFNRGLTKIVPPPDFDFKIPQVCSINTSGHKWPGCPWPCGIYMTKTGLQLLPPSDPDYIGSPDTTFAGSRNGLSALNWWTYISTYNYDSQVKKVVDGLELAAYTYAELQKFPQDIWLAYTPLTLSIRFKKPNDEITYKYTLAVETMWENNVQRSYIHLYIMGHVTKGMIDSLLKDLQSPDAWESDEELKKKKKGARDDDDDDKEKPLQHGLVVRKKNAGLRNGTVTMMEWPRQGRGFL